MNKLNIFPFCLDAIRKDLWMDNFVMVDCYLVEELRPLLDTVHLNVSSDITQVGFREKL